MTKRPVLLPGNPEEILDVLGRERTQVILGGPGSGKSTLVQYAMLRTCTPASDPTQAPRQLQFPRGLERSLR